jgi:hypothetical protein
MKTLELGIFNGVLQLVVVKLGDAATLGAYLMMMRIAIVALLVLRGGTELMLDNQPGINQQDDGVVERGPAHAEVFLIDHERIEGINVEMAFDRIDGIENGIALRGFPVAIDMQVFGEYLLDCFFKVLIFHCLETYLLSGNKVNGF